MTARYPFSDDFEDLLDAERDLDGPATPTRARMFSRLAPLLLPPSGSALGAPAPSGPSASAVGSPSGMSAVGAAGAGASIVASTGWRAAIAISALSVAVGAGGGATTRAWLTSEKPRPAVVSAPVEGRTPARPVASAAATAEEASPETAASAPSLTKPPATTRPEEQVRGTASLRAERLLIERAAAALARRDHASAFAALRKHAASFPKGELAQEREALLVQALKASGDPAAAERRAKDFKKRFPGSLQQGTVDEASRRE